MDARHSDEFCVHCNIELPTLRRRYYVDLNGREVVLHEGCREEYVLLSVIRFILRSLGLEKVGKERRKGMV